MPPPRRWPESQSAGAVSSTGPTGSSELEGREKMLSMPNRDLENGWTVETHREFVSSVFSEGLTHASPSIIRENMTLPDSSLITNDRIKSHLQKYRKYKARSKNEFMDEYDSWITQAAQAAGTGNLLMNTTPLISPDEILNAVNSSDFLASGELAAFLTYCEIAGDRNGPHREVAAPDVQHVLSTSSETDTGARWLAGRDKSQADIMKILSRLSTFEFNFPVLTEQEKRSSVGRMMAYVMGLCLELKREILETRKTSDIQGSGGGPNIKDRAKKKPAHDRDGEDRYITGKQAGILAKHGRAADTKATAPVAKRVRYEEQPSIVRPPVVPGDDRQHAGYKKSRGAMNLRFTTPHSPYHPASSYHGQPHYPTTASHANPYGHGFHPSSSSTHYVVSHYSDRTGGSRAGGTQLQGAPSHDHRLDSGYGNEVSSTSVARSDFDENEHDSPEDH